jgi:hypothetical protein
MSKPSQQEATSDQIYFYQTTHRQRVSATYFLLFACIAYSSTLNMEAVLSFETSGNFHQTTWLHITEDGALN